MSGHTFILSSPTARQQALRTLMQAPDDAVVKISPPKRTLDQNAKMWAMLSDVSRAKPGGRAHTPETWKALFMHACGHEVQFGQGLDGTPFSMGFRTSRLSKAQMAELIEFIYAWCADYDVRWSCPEWEDVA